MTLPETANMKAHLHTRQLLKALAALGYAPTMQEAAERAVQNWREHFDPQAGVGDHRNALAVIRNAPRGTAKTLKVYEKTKEVLRSIKDESQQEDHDLYMTQLFHFLVLREAEKNLPADTIRTILGYADAIVLPGDQVEE